MKGLIAVLAVVALAGCTSGWSHYAATHRCQATEQTLRKPVVNPFSTLSSAGAPGAGLVPIGSPGLDLRYESYRLYRCDNGSIWGPLSTYGKESP